FLMDRPIRGICSTGWWYSFEKTIRERKLKVILGGDNGNVGLSYDGIELLPELLRSGRWLCLWREASALVATRGLRWRGVFANTFGPWCPPTLWRWANKIARRYVPDVGDYTAISRRRLDELDLQARARARNHDFVARPWKHSFAMRLHCLQTVDN